MAVIVTDARGLVLFANDTAVSLYSAGESLTGAQAA